jgi:hypothetical protein
VDLGGDTKAVLLASAAMFLWALLLGVLKYRQILDSEEGRAHPYTDIAHRAALLYSFALLLIAVFVELSGWDTAVNLVAATAMSVFFFGSVAGYTFHGWRQDIDNQLRNPSGPIRSYMVALIAAEIVGWLVLVAGFLDAQVF